MALLHFRTSPRVRVRATVKLSAAFFNDESSITIGGYESAIALFLLGDPDWFILLIKLVDPLQMKSKRTQHI